MAKAKDKKQDNAEEKDVKQPIIIKKIKKISGGHHGGSWKIAYADFVTAMMAFFLLMWLISSLNKAQKEGIADYFKQPLKIALMSGSSSGARATDVKGGGKDVEEKDGVVAANNQPVTNKVVIEAPTPGQKQENKELESLKASIQMALNKDPSLIDLKEHLLMDNVKDGLRIQLIDNQNKPMFDTGSDKMDPKVEKLLNKISKLIVKMPNKIIIQGHTDAHPYQNPDHEGVTNWELSTQRANAARRALVKAGMPMDKVLEVTGYASTVLLDQSDAYNPNNRRISIIVMKKEAENRFLKDAHEQNALDSQLPSAKPQSKSGKKQKNTPKAASH